MITILFFSVLVCITGIIILFVGFDQDKIFNRHPFDYQQNSLAVKFGMIDAGPLSWMVIDNWGNLGSSEMFKQQNTRLRDCALILLGNQVLTTPDRLNQHHMIVFSPTHVSSGSNRILNKIIQYVQNFNSRLHIEPKYHVVYFI